MRAWLLCMFLAACGSGADAPPPDLMRREQFKDVLLEAQLIESRTNQELVLQQQGLVPTKDYYAELFEAKGVTREQFEHTFDFYTKRPKELKAIYEEIITEMSRRKDLPPQPADTLSK